MPIARIDIPHGKPAAYGRTVADVVYETLRAVLNVPENDRFQIVSQHQVGDGLIIDPTYLGIERSADALIVQITLSEGRSVELKQAFYKTLADNLHDRIGLRREDLMINLVEVKKENWSFGNGIAQYV
ncbi:tautomerase family protein [Mangrovibrevibacter kandeliae]|uniref:tautomerase family protein n=1 Tax=Mangrovibrevibacter kandeliae TaxID=2968473 RepID=UPI0021175014|nr:MULTISPECIES: tautomerase family protein [unclassified Aurantimonas]MCQ8781350.1 tautomerase family protein [Aurantimonas sp. CSK15Z-1]MCW4114132.1 tautomerase family protein [Aurantimonas sp. MSK8Z-1]